MSPTRTLLVEGDDDMHVLRHLCGTRGVGGVHNFVPHGGVEALLEAISVYAKRAGDTEIVGIVIDADTDLGARWVAIRHRLEEAGYKDVPDAPDRQGTIVDPPDGAYLPRVGIWLMPDNMLPGILEDFLAFMVPEESPLFEHARKSVAAIPPGEQRFTDVARPKALIHTWLAWQKEPGKPLGTAITARFLDPKDSRADALVAWLKRLYRS